MKIFQNLYWSSKTQASLSKLGKLDGSRVLLFAPHLPLKWGAWGANIKCPSIWGAYLIADSNSLGAGANLDNCPFCHSGCQLLVQTGCRVLVKFLFLSKQSLDSLVRHLCGTLGAERYIIQTLKDHFQTIYFKYNVYCSSFTKELPRLPPEKIKSEKNSKFILIQKLKQAWKIG